MLPTADPEEDSLAATKGKDDSKDLIDKISSELWEAVLEGFQYLSTNFTSTGGYKTNPVLATLGRTTTEKPPPDSSLYTFESAPKDATSDIFISSKLNELSFTSQEITINPVNLSTVSTLRPPNRLYPYFPAIYNMDECRTMNFTSDPLYECEKPGLVFVFGTLALILGVVAIFGNCIMPIVVWRRKSMRTRQNFIKVSLAFNDMISGFILLFSVLPNLIWFRSSSESEVLDGYERTENSPMAIIAGSSLIIALQGSLFHLMFLSADRFIAIKWPLYNRHRRRSRVIWILVGIWLLLIIGSIATAAYPTYFRYAYNTQVFMYTLGYVGEKDSMLHGLLHFGLALFFPYVTTIVLTILTGAVAFRELNKFPASNRTYAYSGATSRSDRSSVECSDEQKPISRDDSKNDRPELAIAKTIMIMTGAFVVAWSIFFVIFFLSYHGLKQDPETTAIIYMISFYSGLSNSVANVIIYSVRDERFRAAVVATFFKRKVKSRNGTVSMCENGHIGNTASNKKTVADEQF